MRVQKAETRFSPRLFALQNCLPFCLQAVHGRTCYILGPNLHRVAAISARAFRGHPPATMISSDS